MTTFTITTKRTTTPTGASRIIAKGHGKQRTIPMDYALTTEAKHASACGALLDVLTDDRQQAMLRHPSAKQRVRRVVNDDGSTVWNIAL